MRYRGFTLFEILIVMAIMTFVVGFGLFMSMDTFRGSSFRSDRDLLVALLQHARSQAVNNICVASTCTDGSAHGVHIDAANHLFIGFEGSTYDASSTQNQIFTASPATTATTTATGANIIFNQLDGTTASTVTITLTAAGKTSTITVDTTGRISWTN